MPNFGGNTISSSGSSSNMRLINGGPWTFEQRELIQLDEIAREIQERISPVEMRIWRNTSASVVRVEHGLGEEVYLREGNVEGHFLIRELAELRIAIGMIVPVINERYSFGDNRIKLYAGGLYALILVNGEIWVFNAPEIRQLRDILLRIPPRGTIPRTTGGGLVTVEYSLGKIELTERSHTGYFSEVEAGALRSAIDSL